jgi:Flp pilus assembly pilin Flp
MLRSFTLKRLPQADQGGTALEYSLVLLLVAFAIVTGTSTWGIGMVFELLATSRITQVIGFAEKFV